MYSVSDAYKSAVADSHRKSKMRAVLTVDGTALDLDDNDIIKDTVYVTNQCTNGSEYEYGCVYSGECGLTIKSAVDRYSLYDAELKLYWSLWTSSAWEEIPIGVYYISEPNRINDKISIKALDGMTKLDVNVDEDTTGTLPQLMTYIAEKCGVELAQTEGEYAEFINSDVQYSVQQERIATYRDLLSYICMMSACFATMDRFGKLKLVKYATESSVTLGKKHRFTNASFSDYTTSFSGIKARFIAEENYAPYDEKDETSNGLVLDMGDIPIVRGLPETKHEVLSAVFDVLKTVSYTPCEIETLGNPALDLGDYITNNDVGSDKKTYLSPITYYNWTYRGKHKLRAVGGNPRLANVKSKQDKQISSLNSELDAKNIVVKEFNNSDAIIFSKDATEIAVLNFASTETNKPILMLCVRLETDLDGLLVLQFCKDGIADTERTYKQYVERGNHIVTLVEAYASKENDRHTISVMAHMEYYESDSRKQDAEIKTHNNFLEAIKTTGATVTDNVVSFPTYEVGVIDETVATATIKKSDVNMILYGQGVAGDGGWDGTINLSEELPVVEFKGQLAFDNRVLENFNTSLQVPTAGNIAESVGIIPFKNNFGFRSVADFVNFGEVIKDYVFNTEKAYLYEFDKYITTNNGMYSLKTIYNYDSVEETIDSGKMCSVAIDYTGLTVESVVVENA